MLQIMSIEINVSQILLRIIALKTGYYVESKVIISKKGFQTMTNLSQASHLRPILQHFSQTQLQSNQLRECINKEGLLDAIAYIDSRRAALLVVECMVCTTILHGALLV